MSEASETPYCAECDVQGVGLTSCYKCKRSFCDECAPQMMMPNQDHSEYLCKDTTCVENVPDDALKASVPKATQALTTPPAPTQPALPIITTATPSFTRPKPARRHRVVRRNTLEGITLPEIRRLARRGGVSRMSKDCVPEIRTCLKNFLSKTLEHAVIYADHEKRSTLCVRDIVYALRRQGQVLYGFSDPRSILG